MSRKRRTHAYRVSRDHIKALVPDSDSIDMDALVQALAEHLRLHERKRMCLAMEHEDEDTDSAPPTPQTPPAAVQQTAVNEEGPVAFVLPPVPDSPVPDSPATSRAPSPQPPTPPAAATASAAVPPPPSTAATTEEEWLETPFNGLRLRAPHVLLDHQIGSVQWVLQQENQPQPWHGVRGGVLSLEMGLGKTLVSLVASLCQRVPHQAATLYVTEKTLVDAVLGDVRKFFGNTVRVLVWNKQRLGEDVFVRFSDQTPFRNDIVVVTYDTVVQMGVLAKMTVQSQADVARAAEQPELVRAAHAFFAAPWFRVIADESQRFANHATKLSSCMMRFAPGRRLCLTGTKVRNYEDDLFNQLRFCGLDLDLPHKEWNVENFQRYDLRRLVLERTIADSGVQLPERHVHRVYCDLPPRQKEVYAVYVERNLRTMNAFHTQQATMIHVLQMFMRLRQVCVSPYLIVANLEPGKLSRAEEKKRAVELAALRAPGGVLGRDRLELDRELRNVQSCLGLGAVKLDTLRRMCRETVGPHEKALIYTKWTECMKLCATVLRQDHGASSVLTMDGKTVDRSKVVGAFQEQPHIRFLCMTSVGCLGLTMTEATHVIIMEPDWNHVASAQVSARIWRIGQTKPVNIHHLLIRNSIEDYMLDKCEEKRIHQDGVKGLTGDDLTESTKAELQNIFAALFKVAPQDVSF